MNSLNSSNSIPNFANDMVNTDTLISPITTQYEDQSNTIDLPINSKNEQITKLARQTLQEVSKPIEREISAEKGLNLDPVLLARVKDAPISNKIKALKLEKAEIKSEITNLKKNSLLSRREVINSKSQLEERLISIQAKIKELTKELKGKEKVVSETIDPTDSNEESMPVDANKGQDSSIEDTENSTPYTSMELESQSPTFVEIEDVQSSEKAPTPAKINDPIKLDSKKSSMQGIINEALENLKNRPGIDKDSIEIKADFKKDNQGKYQVDRFKSPHIKDENLCSFECSFEITFKDAEGNSYSIKADPPQTVYTSTSDPAKGVEVAMKFANLASQMALANQDLNGHVEGLNDDNKKAMMSQSSFVFSPDSSGRMNNIKTESGFELKPANQENNLLFDANTRKYTKKEKGVTVGPHQKIYSEIEFAKKNYAEGIEYLRSIGEDRKKREEYLSQKLSHLKSIMADFKQAKGDLTSDKSSIQGNIKQFIGNAIGNVMGKQENASSKLKEYTEMRKQFEKTYQRTPDRVDEDLAFIETIPDAPLSEELKQELQSKFNIDSHEQLVELKQNLQIEKQDAVQLGEYRQAVIQDNLKNIRALTDAHVRLGQELSELQNFKEGLSNIEKELQETAESPEAKTELDQVIKDSKKLDRLIVELENKIQKTEQYLDNLPKIDDF